MKNENMHIYSNPDTSDVLQKATEKLNNLLESNKENNTLLLLSGGSALQLIDGINAKYMSPTLTVSVLDERYSHDKNINNFAQITKTSFYRKLQEEEAEVIDTRLQAGEGLKDLGKRFEERLRLWRRKNPTGKTIISQGFGSDAHTAGIMPFEDEEQQRFQELFVNNGWVAAYDAENKNPYRYRVTTTFPFLKNEVDHSICFVIGQEKKDALESILRENIDHHICPGRIIHEMKDVHIFTEHK